ncbi:MAG: transglycosylase domain-containing protein [Caulobacteraceae bacterium]
MLALIAALALNASAFQLPALPPIRRDPQVTFLDRHGEVIGLRGGRYGPPVDLASLPRYAPEAFVAIEDRRFWSNLGFDPMGMARALFADLAAGGKPVQGASTITQQLARNLFLSDQQTVERKAKELVYAVELERAYSKRQILGLYLSRVYFGEGAWGIDAAARRYFDRPASRLTLRQAAMLAALMKSPVEYDPIEHPEASAERTALVLDAMVESGAITPAERAHALRESAFVHHIAPDAPDQWFVDWMDAKVKRLVGPPRADETVVTTLDQGSEEAAARAVRLVLARYRRAGASEAALVALDGDGRIRAFIGGTDYATGPYDRAIDARRQAGSAWKLFVYLTAMENGLTPQTVELDGPVTIDGWSPRDFEPTFLGPIPISTAVAQSVNTVAAKVADEIGRDKIAATARRLGIWTPINTDPAMALGTSLVTPLEMAEAYDALADGGNRVGAWGVEEVRSGSRVLFAAHPQPTFPVIANPPLTEMDQMLRGVVASGTGVNAAIPGRDIAGKTGTASNFQDAWFCGFTGGLTAVVWVGADDNAPMRGVTGGSAPARIWRDFMQTALRRLPNGPIPPGPPAPAPTLPLPVPVSSPGAASGTEPAGPPTAAPSPPLSAPTPQQPTEPSRPPSQPPPFSG